MSRWPAYDDAIRVPLAHTSAIELEIAVGNVCQFCIVPFKHKGDGAPRACLNCEPGGGKYPKKREGKRHAPKT